MAKLNKVAHARLLLQAEEAQERGLDRLADGILFAISSNVNKNVEDPEEDFEENTEEEFEESPEESFEEDFDEENDEENDEDSDEDSEEDSEEDSDEELDEESDQYAYDQLKEEIYKGLWELATRVAKYHDCEHIDAEKLGDVVDTLAQQFIEEVEDSLQIEEGSIGPFEPKVMGELE